MNVLVLGGTRFLGLYVVRALVQRGHRVAALNVDPNATSVLPPEAESIACDRRDYERLKQALSGRHVDAVIDIVSLPTLPRDIAAVLEATGTELRRYIFSSSTTVYQKTGVYPITEDFPRAGKEEFGPYTAAKLECENFLFQQYEQRRLPITIIRPTKIYGPDGYTYREGFHFDRLTRNRPILIPNDGNMLAQFGYVEDLAEAFCLALEREQAVGQAYTITGSEMITLNSYIDLLAEIVGVEPRKVYFDTRLLKRFAKPGLYFGDAWRQEGHDCYDISKAREQLGYLPKVNVREGFRRTFAWYQETGGEAYEGRVLDFSFEDELIALATAGTA
jgi:nucleoside-diphosphate-sugar epimerase